MSEPKDPKPVTIESKCSDIEKHQSRIDERLNELDLTVLDMEDYYTSPDTVTEEGLDKFNLQRAQLAFDSAEVIVERNKLVQALKDITAGIPDDDVTHVKRIGDIAEKLAETATKLEAFNARVAALSSRSSEVDKDSLK